MLTDHAFETRGNKCPVFWVELTSTPAHSVFQGGGGTRGPYIPKLLRTGLASVLRCWLVAQWLTTMMLFARTGRDSATFRLRMSAASTWRQRRAAPTGEEQRRKKATKKVSRPLEAGASAHRANHPQTGNQRMGGVASSARSSSTWGWRFKRFQP